MQDETTYGAFDEPGCCNACGRRSDDLKHVRAEGLLCRLCRGDMYGPAESKVLTHATEVVEEAGG